MSGRWKWRESEVSTCPWQTAERMAVTASGAAAGPGSFRAIGVDGCRGGWFYCASHGSYFRWGLAASFSEVLACAARGSRVFVDIPIGLTGPSCAVRSCDTLARRRLGPRAASVFPTPSRASLDCADYVSASRRNQQITGRKLSRQTWNLVGKIREVDIALGQREAMDRIVHESHPELCFAAFAGRPMDHYKKTEAGFRERLAVLDACYTDSRAIVDDALDSLRRAEVARDDIVDALVLAFAARLAPQDLETLPAEPERDQIGRPMAITCPRTRQR